MSEREVVNCRPLGFVGKLGVAWGVLLVVAGAMWGAATVVANRRMSKAEAAWRELGLPSTVEAVALPKIVDAEKAATQFYLAGTQCCRFTFGLERHF